MTDNLNRRPGNNKLPSLLFGIALGILILSLALALSVQQHNIYVHAASQPPTVSFAFTPSRPWIEYPVTLTATASGGTAPYTFSWRFGDGVNGTGNPAIHTYAVGGLYNITLTVTDNMGVIVSTNKLIDVQSFNSPPQPAFKWTPEPPFAGDTIFFDGSASRDADPLDGTIVSYSWDFGDGSSGTGIGLLHAYSSPGAYVVTLSVTDNSGAARDLSLTLWVRPSLTLTVSANVTQGLAPLYIWFNASASEGQFPYTFSWDFGDGQISTRPFLAHNYTIPRVYRVHVIVTDLVGHTASKEIVITVTPRPFDPTFFGLSHTTLQIGGALTVSGFVPLMIYALVRRRSNGGNNDSRDR